MIGKRYVFKVIDEQSNKEVASIEIVETLFEEKATIQVKDEAKLPVDLKISDRKSEALLDFLKGRVLPANRMFIGQELREKRMDPSDWKEMIKANQGKTYTDNYMIQMELEEQI